MGLSSIVSIIHMVTIATMLNFNDGNNGHGLKNVACEQGFKTLLRNYTHFGLLRSHIVITSDKLVCF